MHKQLYVTARIDKEVMILVSCMQFEFIPFSYLFMSSCTTQPSTLYENAGFRVVINAVIFSAIMIRLITLDILLAMAARFGYGAGRCIEVWAPSLSMDFEKWESSNLHVRFCKGR